MVTKKILLPLTKDFVFEYNVMGKGRPDVNRFSLRSREPHLQHFGLFLMRFLRS